MGGVRARTWIALIALFVVACASSAGFINAMRFDRPAETETFQEANSYRYGLGETAVLDSRLDEDGMRNGWMASFDWEGAIELTVDSVELFKINDQSIPYEMDESAVDFARDQSDDPLLVVFGMTVRNIDAESAVADDPDWFYASTYLLNGAIDSDPAVLDASVVATGESSDPRNGLQFSVGKGESKTLRMGWFTDGDRSIDELKILVGSSGIDKYSFMIPLPE